MSTSERLTRQAMLTGFGESLIAAREANVTAILAGAAYAIMSCHPSFPRHEKDNKVLPAVVQDEIREYGEKYLAKGKSAKYQLAADAFTLGQKVIARFKTGKDDKVDGDCPHLFRIMSEAATAADATNALREACRSWFGHDSMTNVSGFMATVKGETKPKAGGRKKQETEHVTVIPTLDVLADEIPKATLFGITEARKVIAPALARLIKAGDRDALIALLADVEAAIGQVSASPATEAPAPATEAA